MESSIAVTLAMAERFKLLGDGSRLSIVMAILEPRSVSDIAEACDLSLSLVSHHLRLLKAADLVRSERRGKQIFYHIHDGHVQHLLHDMHTHITQCSGTAALAPRNNTHEHHHHLPKLHLHP